MMLSDKLATDHTLGFKVARLFTISDRLMVVVYGIVGSCVIFSGKVR